MIFTPKCPFCNKKLQSLGNTLYDCGYCLTNCQLEKVRFQISNIFNKIHYIFLDTILQTSESKLAIMGRFSNEVNEITIYNKKNLVYKHLKIIILPLDIKITPSNFKRKIENYLLLQ